jgi:hypothetical protein
VCTGHGTGYRTADKKGWTKKITVVNSVGVNANGDLIVDGSDMIIKDGIIVNMKQRTWKHGDETTSGDCVVKITNDAI